MRALMVLTDVVIGLPALISWMNNNLFEPNFVCRFVECVEASAVVESIWPFEFGYFMQS